MGTMSDPLFDAVFPPNSTDVRHEVIEGAEVAEVVSFVWPMPIGVPRRVTISVGPPAKFKRITHIVCRR